MKGKEDGFLHTYIIPELGLEKEGGKVKGGRRRWSFKNRVPLGKGEAQMGEGEAQKEVVVENDPLG